MRYSKLFDLRNMDKYQYSLEDLKQVLKTDILQEFSYKLREDFESRLLIPGIPTSKIIEQYIKTIRILRILDPSAVCLEIVSEPIKEYLRGRPDTLESIIDIVIYQEDNKLYNQLGQQYTQIPLKYHEEEEKKQPKTFIAPNLKKNNKDKKEEMNILSEGKDDYYYISSDEDEEAARKWKPAPINAKMNRHISTKFLKSDIISTLINIYGSQDQFLQEYRNMLGERLLNSKEFDLNKEYKNVELLKSRFGDMSMLYCDVMLKDIKESERSLHAYKTEINDNKRIKFSEDNILDTKNIEIITISKEYWNVSVDDAQFKFPYTVNEPFEAYSKHYSEKQKLSEINYLSNFGNIDLTLTFDNGPFTFNVSPIHAAIISLFDGEDDKFSDEWLAEKLSITTTQLKESIQFWVMRGVLIEEQMKSLIAETMSKQNPNGDKSGIVTVYYTPKVLEQAFI
jgi:anaphase-promoting complex subunit 2